MNLPQRATNRRCFVTSAAHDGRHENFRHFLHATLRRIERETPGAAGAAHVELVRRLRPEEAARVDSGGSPGEWFEIRGYVPCVAGEP